MEAISLGVGDIAQFVDDLRLGSLDETRGLDPEQSPFLLHAVRIGDRQVDGNALERAGSLVVNQDVEHDVDQGRLSRHVAFAFPFPFDVGFRVGAGLVRCHRLGAGRRQHRERLDLRDVAGASLGHTATATAGQREQRDGRDECQRHVLPSPRCPIQSPLHRVSLSFRQPSSPVRP